MKVNRGDVVLIDYPYSDAAGSKVRPVLVAQSEARNALLTNTVVAMITKNTSRVGIDSTQVLIDISTPDRALSGLTLTSAVTCGNLFTLHEDLVRRKIGDLPTVLMRQVDDALKAALDLP